MKTRMVSVDEYSDVVSVAARYIEALRTGDTTLLAGIFHKDAVTYGTVDGALVGGSGNPAAEFIRNHGKSSQIESHIDVLDMTPTTAVVRIVMQKDAIGSDCNANLLLIKCDDGWTVFAKVFHQFDM